MTPPRSTAAALTGYQRLIIALLAFLQFTIILDFMVLAPLGAIIMPALKVPPAGFGALVSVYAFSAGAAGLLAAGFSDRFDRKKLLLFFYLGFIVGTLLCALADSYRFLLIARIVTGLFGGVIGSIVFAITTDLFDYQLRGRVMGVVQAAFAASNVLGLPIGLYLANRWNWHAPFYLIVITSTAVGVLIVLTVRPINAHLLNKPDKSPLHHFLHTISTPRYLQGFLATVLLATGGFMLLPFSSAYTVNNLGINVGRLPLIYMVTGIFAMVFGPLIGRLSDAIGKFKVFALGCAATIIMVLIYTNLGVTPLQLVMLVNVLLFIGVSSRMISASALISAVPSPADRGSYMSISSSLQQISGGIAAAVAGMIVKQAPDGVLQHIDILGYVLVATTLLTLIMMYYINRMVEASAGLLSVASSGD
ncbi:MAG: MFS transporter [Steroidobacteraceae bacterium]|jgi:predicted MFS family arabinose efflux permease